MAPPAMKGTTFKKDGSSDARPVMNSIMFYVENQTCRASSGFPDSTFNAISFSTCLSLRKCLLQAVSYI